MDKRILIVAILAIIAIVGIGIATMGGDQGDNQGSEVLSNNSLAEEAPEPVSSNSSTGTSTSTSSTTAPERINAAAKQEIKYSIRGQVVDAEGPIGGVRLALISDAIKGDEKPIVESALAPEEMPEEGSAEGEQPAVIAAVGSFEFSDLTFTDSASIAVISEGWAIQLHQLPELDGEDLDGVTITVTPAAAIEVEVLLSQVESPLEGAAIAVSLEDESLTPLVAMACETLVTDANGKLLLNCLPEGEVTLRAAKEGFTAALRSEGEESIDLSTASAVLGAEERATRTLYLEGGLTLIGRVVTEADGKAIAEALVELLGNFNAVIEFDLCDEEGRFKIFVPQFHPMMAVRVSAPGYAYTIRRGIQPSGAVHDLGDIKLGLGAIISGYVRDEQSQGIAGALVSLNDNFMEDAAVKVRGVRQFPRFVTTTTDAEGFYQLQNVPTAPPQRMNIGMPMMGNMRIRSVVASAEGYAPGLSQPLNNLVPGETTTVDLTLKRAGRIVGTVTALNGVPIPGVIVAALPAKESSLAMIMRMMLGSEVQMREMAGSALNDLFSIASDEEGNYVIDQLEEGRYIVGAYHREHGREILEAIEVKSGEDTRVDIRLGTTSAIEGFYYDSVGRAVGGKTVNLFDTAFMSGNNRSAQTDSTGYYRIDNLKPGTYRVVVGASLGMNDIMRSIGTASAVKIEEGKTSKFDIYEIIPGTSTIFGKVTIDGKPYTGRFMISGGGLGGLSGRFSERCDDEGNYRIRNLPLGTYIFIPIGGGSNLLRNTRFRVDTLPEQEINIDFKTYVITGVVSVPGLSEIPDDLAVFAAPSSKPKQAGYMEPAFEQIFQTFNKNADINRKTGEYTIKGMSPGTYRVFARSESAGYARSNPFELQDDVFGIRLEVSGGTGSVRGIVENYVAPDDENPMTMMDRMVALTVFDEDGSVVNLGGRRVQEPNNMVRLDAIPGTDNYQFQIDGIPVGVWSATVQVTNYAPITIDSIDIQKDLVVERRFVLAESGNLEVQVMNEDLDPEAAQELRYKITASNGQAYNRRFTAFDFMRNLINPPDPSLKGVFMLPDFAPDSYTIVFDLPGYQQATKNFTINAGQTTRIQVRFEKK